MNTRSTSNSQSQFIELPVHTRTKKLTLKNPDPTVCLHLKHPDTISPISRNHNMKHALAMPVLKRQNRIESSKEWLNNKRQRRDIGNYSYICGKPNLDSGRKCICVSHDLIGLYSGCIKHYMWEELLNKYMDEDFLD